MAVSEQQFSSTVSEVFEVLVTPESYPRWLVGARRIRAVSPDWPQPGSSFQHVVGFGPIAIADRSTVRAAEAPRMLEMQVRARPLIEATVRFEITDSPTGCTVRMTETPSGVHKLASTIAQPLIAHATSVR
ncbi:MAG: SRPBCC domain-containing protein [Acidimicrobiia bacterium]